MGHRFGQECQECQECPRSVEFHALQYRHWNRPRQYIGMEKSAEVAVIGAGIVGLAIAYHEAKRGKKVVLFDRNPQAVGASVRNFGLLWPIGQPFGPLHERAMRSREIWLEIIEAAKLWSAPTGSLHLAYHADEWEVLQEFFAIGSTYDAGQSLLSTSQVLEKSTVANRQGLKGGLWSPTEITVDPRQAVRALPKFLREKYQIELRLGFPVNALSYPQFQSCGETWQADRIYVCTGPDLEMLYPEIFASSGMTKSKLQMMRTRPQPAGWELGPSICGGLTLIHYESFKFCQSLKALRERFRQERQFAAENGIHVLLSQTALGELTIGDSHHYGLNPEPFDREEINREILDYLKTFAVLPNLEIAERWHGVYTKLAGQTEFIAEPEPGVIIVNGLGGAGMTLSFGLAEEIVRARSRTKYSSGIFDLG